MLLKILSIVGAALMVLYGAWTLLADASNELLVGKAQVITGDTLEIAGERIQIFGINSPEPNQVCDYHGTKWLCGAKSAIEVARWIGGSTLVCRRRSTPPSRTASCMKGAVDVGRWAIRHGWAVADTCRSRSYVDDQEKARRARVGMWSSSFPMPRLSC